MKQKNHRLNSVSAGTEAVMNVVLALFSLCCIIPFIFVVIISFSSEESIRTIGYSFWPMAWSTDTYAYAFEKLPQHIQKYGSLEPPESVTQRELFERVRFKFRHKLAV